MFAEAMLDVHHEEVVHDPKAQIERLLTYLGLEAQPAFVDAAASIVYDSPHRSREKIPWTEAQQQLVLERAAAYPWL